MKISDNLTKSEITILFNLLSREMRYCPKEKMLEASKLLIKLDNAKRNSNSV